MFDCQPCQWAWAGSIAPCLQIPTQLLRGECLTTGGGSGGIDGKRAGMGGFWGLQCAAI